MQVLAARWTVWNSCASSDGERPAEGRADRDDEGLRTPARTVGEPAAEGRTARRDGPSLGGDE